MSATTIDDPNREVDPNRVHDEFPQSVIRDGARKLEVIADAYQVGVGGFYGVANLLIDAINTAETLAQALVMKAKELGVLSQDAPESNGTRICA